MSVFTLGHSTRPLPEFLAMLQAAGVRLLLDVRAFPRSRSNPAYNIETLPDALAGRQIGYLHCRDLGGRRGRQPVDPAVNALWRVQSFHNYADYALGAEFAAAFARLLALAEAQPLAIMCSEAVWWRCHRRIIADHLLLAGHAVTHLLGPGHSQPAVPPPGVQRTAAGQVVYPAPP